MDVLSQYSVCIAASVTLAAAASLISVPTDAAAPRYEVTVHDDPSFGFSDTGATVVVDDSLFVVNNFTRTITELTMSSGTVVQVIVDADTPDDAPSLGGVFQAVTDGSSVWVVNNSSTTVSQFDAATGDFVRSYGLTDAGFANPLASMGVDDDYLYVPSAGNNSLMVFSTSTGELVDTLTDPAFQFTTTTTVPGPIAPTTTGAVAELPATGPGSSSRFSVLAGLLATGGLALLILSRRTRATR